MTDLKEDFRQWLIKQGLSEKTATGRHGTVYEYVRRIDKLCNLIYKGHDLKSWQQLAEDIYPILGFHLLCRKGDVCVTQNNIAEIKDFLETFLSNLNPYQENLENYFEVKLQLDNGDCVEHYTLIKDLLPSLTTQTLLLKFSASATQVNKNRNALEKFYQFLSDTQYINAGSSCYKRISEKTKINIFYNELAQKIKIIKSYPTNGNNQIFRIIIKGGNNIDPPKIEPRNTALGYETKAHFEDVREILGISRWTLKRLASSSKEFRLSPINIDFKEYYIDDVNKYIIAHFTRSTTDNKYKGRILKKWWTASKVQKKLGCNSKKVERLRNDGHFTYLHISQSIYLYYPDSVIRFCKKT